MENTLNKMLFFYPEKHSQSRPFFVEIRTENNIKSFQLFQANYFYTEEEWETVSKHPFLNNEVHPWNLGLEGDLIDIRYPDSVCFWKEDFIKFVVDAMNDKFEKDYKK